MRSFALAAILLVVVTAPSWSAQNGATEDPVPFGYFPADVTLDPTGSLYVVDPKHSVVQRITPDGMRNTVAGTGVAGYSGDGGPATNAKLAHPLAVTVDKAGNLYIADTENGRVRKVTPDGRISTVADTLEYPASIAVDGAGTIYVGEFSSHRVRTIASDGTVRPFAGNGTQGFDGDGGPATKARLRYPYGVATDAQGNVYIADTGNARIRKVSSDGKISTIAGNGKYGFDRDFVAATSARLYVPLGVAVDANGNLYIADTGNARIRKVTSTGQITSLAGDGTHNSSGDGGPASAGHLDMPYRLAADGVGNVYIADPGGQRIRKVTDAGSITTVGDIPNITTNIDRPSTDGVYRVKEGVTPPRVLHRVEPQYTEDARWIRLQGTVIFEAILRKNGAIEIIRVIHSMGFGLDESAASALLQWEFRPGIRDGMAVDVALNIEVNFNLR